MRSQAVQSDTESLAQYHFSKCYPFVKWAGGKGQLMAEINKFIPLSFDRYFEPFLGGAATFFYLVSGKNCRFDAFLSDTNDELINVYIVIKDSVEELIKLLRHHEREYNKSREEYYYNLRASRPFNSVERAAKFITLNKTCYNGLYRVNKKGLFNVPMGRYKNPMICDAQNLRNINLVLRKSNSQLKVEDYKIMLVDNAEKNDFIYLDPPYNPTSNTANFTGYTNTGFNREDQYQLADVFKKLDKRGCRILLSNSNTPVIRKLYHGYSSVEVQVNRAINSKASKRTGHTELLIRNYN